MNQQPIVISRLVALTLVKALYASDVAADPHYFERLVPPNDKGYVLHVTSLASACARSDLTDFLALHAPALRVDVENRCPRVLSYFPHTVYITFSGNVDGSTMCEPRSYEMLFYKGEPNHWHSMAIPLITAVH